MRSGSCSTIPAIAGELKDMQLKDQVVSLELSKRFKKLGFKRDSLFAYYRNAGIWHDAIVDMGMYKDVDDDFKEAKLLPAYTVAELAQIIPDKLVDGKYHFHIYRLPEWLKENDYKMKDGWACGYEVYDWDQMSCRHYWGGWFVWKHSEKLADAMALLLEYLAKVNLINPAEF
ncbi:MAG: hypothetical protein PHO56_02130 [Patescibacteria group bacterium]|nr:hypothetical protein [Patescibacteria group bacterium]